MTPGQLIGYMLNQTTAVSSITSNRIWEGTRPKSTNGPCINYFEIGGGQKVYGYYRQTYAINCRAATAETAIQISRAVEDLFNGSSGTGIYGSANSFEISRAHTVQFQGLLQEPDSGFYNAPIDVHVVFPSSSIS
jgi:hypothetical protein